LRSRTRDVANKRSSSGLTHWWDFALHVRPGPAPPHHSAWGPGRPGSRRSGKLPSYRHPSVPGTDDAPPVTTRATATRRTPTSCRGTLHTGSSPINQELLSTTKAKRNDKVRGMHAPAALPALPGPSSRPTLQLAPVSGSRHQVRLGASTPALQHPRTKASLTSRRH
jgi:hypothetical protein